MPKGDTAIDRLNRLNNIEDPNAGQIILLTILLPIVEIGFQVGRGIETIGDFFIIPIQRFIEGIGMFIIDLLAGAAGIVAAASGASASAFREGIFATLGPVAFPLGILTVGSGALALAWVVSQQETADSLTSLFSATDVPVIGTEEETDDG